MTLTLMAKRPLASFLAVLMVVLACPPTAARGQTRAVDLSDAKGWTLHPSHEAVKATLEPTAKGDGFTLSYNFTGGSGFVIARHAFDVDLPENYEVSFTLSGTGPSNDLEVKLLDAATPSGGKLGDSVWWVKRRNFEWPGGGNAGGGAGVRINNKAKHFSFAWGPLNGAKIKRLGAVEIVVASSSGGKGTITVSDIQFRPLPVSKPYAGKPTATATSSDEDGPPASAIDGKSLTGWRTALTTPQALTVDYGELREVDAVHIRWLYPVGAFRIEVSDDGTTWRDVWGADLACCYETWADVPGSTARFLRLRITQAGEHAHARAEAAAGVAEVTVHTRSERGGDDNLGIWRVIAEHDERATGGRLPAFFTGRQPSWTVLGVPDDSEEALINEQGVVELWRGGASLEPALSIDGTLLTWSDADTSSGVRMLDGLPIAEVRRVFPGCTLTVTAFVDGEAGSSTLRTRYSLTNTTSGTVKGSLYWLVRPFQVNPPWQFLGTQGGAASVHSIEPTGSSLVINGTHSVSFPPDARFQVRSFDEGEAGLVLMNGPNPLASRYEDTVTDPHGKASARAERPFTLGAGKSTSWVITVPLTPGAAQIRAESRSFDDLLAAARERWESLLSRVTFNLPPGNEQLSASIRASLGYILINRDGAGFQPGSRSYERSWIRDGALTSAALLEFGLADKVKQFIDWYAGFQFPSGAIPCVVDKRGADPVIENDSHGQFIYALAEYYRYTRDDAFLLKHFSAVEKAVAHIESERGKRRTGEYVGDGSRREPGKPAVPFKAFYGLMPESISHEGYSAKPMHSYWDDFFTLKGLRDAAEIARILKRDEQAKAWTLASQDLHVRIEDSVKYAQIAHKIDYIPGCVELGDFDATSTTVAINPCDALNDLPREWYEATFEKWWKFFVARRDGKAEYIDYTPYEWRIVGSMVMMGQRERAWLSTKWYMQDQLPPRKPGDSSASGWLHWAEIVHKDRGAGKWIGDMPHTWVASDFLRSVRTMFVYEEPSPSPTMTNLVLFAGVPAEWVETPEGVSFRGLQTPYGTLEGSLRKKDGWYVLSYDGLDRTPYRVRLAPPVAWPPKEYEVLVGGGSQNRLTSGVDGITTGMTIRFR